MRSRTRRPFKLTRSGWVFILYTIGLGAGAINTGNNLLYLLFGLFLGLILASGVLSDLSLWRLRLNFLFPSMLTAGEPGLLPLQIVNKKYRLPSLSVSVILEGMLNDIPVTLAVFVPVISSKSVGTAQIFWVPPSRGLFQCQKVKLQTQFPFGLLLKWWFGQNVVPSIAVMPPLKSTKRVAALFGRLEPKAVVSADEKGDSSVLRTVRAYHPTDSIRRIHWKASAKRIATLESGHPGWLVKELEADRHDVVHVDWPASDPTHGDRNQYEEWVSLCASVVRDIDQKGHSVTLNVGTHEVLGFRDIMTFFALILPGQPERTQYLFRSPASRVHRHGFDLGRLVDAL